MSKECQEIHNYIKSLTRYHFPFDKNEIPSNGIYILFETGEFSHDTDRIVRVGTHTGSNNLVKRLEEHFSKENKDRSIFRKNLGRALLNKVDDDYLGVWDLDFTTVKIRSKQGHLLNKEYQMQIEQNISQYIRDNFSFSIIEIEDKDKRMYTEKELIKIVSSCSMCQPSNQWLGHFSTVKKIKSSGLWQTQHVKNQIISK